MTIIKSLTDEMDWICSDMAYNLDFISVDKLEWKPEKTANSAMDIANHAVSSIYDTLAMMGGNPPTAKRSMAKTRTEVQKMLVQGAKDYKNAIKDFKDKDLERKINLPWGERTLLQVIQLPVTDLIHHHGQISYIQTLLGDTENHYVPEDWEVK